MKKLPSTILILLVSACLVAPSAQAKMSAKTRKAIAAAKARALAAARVKRTIAALNDEDSTHSAQAKLAVSFAKTKDSDLLYNAGNTEYLPSKTSFDFGPKSQNFKYDKRMIMAAEIAAERAHKHSTERCWMYVKNALVSANVISSRPTSGYAKEAGDELQNKYGFKKLPISDPFAAPLGSVLVYGGRGAGHVEIRTTRGFVSDFTTDHPSRRPLIGVYVKPS